MFTLSKTIHVSISLGVTRYQSVTLKHPVSLSSSYQTKPELSGDVILATETHLNLEIEAYLKIQQMCNDINAKKDEATILFMLGHTFRQLMQYDKSIEYYQKGLAINERLTNDGMHTNRFDRAEEGSINEWCGYCYDNIDGRHEEALKCYEKAKEISKQLEEKDQEYHLTEAIAKILSNIGEYKKAKKYYQEASEIAWDVGNRHCEARSYLNLATACFNDRDYEMAIKWFDKTLDVAGKEPILPLYNEAATALGRRLAPFRNREIEIQSVEDSQPFAAKEMETGKCHRQLQLFLARQKLRQYLQHGYLLRVSLLI